MARFHPNRLAAPALVVALAASSLHGQQSEPPAATRPATGPATTQAADGPSVDELRKQQEAFLRTLPQVRVGSIKDVVQFAIENDDLAVRTNIPPTDHAAIVVQGLPALISLKTQRGEGSASPYVPEVFNFVRDDYPPDGSSANTQVSVLSGGQRVSLGHTAGKEPDYLLNLDLLQDVAFLEESDHRVRFNVQEHRDGAPLVDLRLSAANITELRRKYPAETMRYLEPVFRQFEQASVLFQVNDRAAWQVLGAKHEPSPELVKQVDALLAKLDAPEAADRDAALKELEKLGQPAALVLMQRDRDGLSAEARTRAETFLAAYAPLPSEDVEKMRNDPEFLLLALSAEDAALSKLALERLREVAKQPIEFDAAATGPGRGEAIAKLRAQLLPATTRPVTTPTTRRTDAETP